MKKLRLLLNNKNALTVYVTQWLLDNAEEPNIKAIKATLEDLMHGGCQSGFVSELCYYNQTTAFYDKYEDEIWELLEDMADQMGEHNALALIGTFNGAKNVGSAAQFKNLLAWAAFEETARNIANQIGIEL
jgi:hypothetical protein